MCAPTPEIIGYARRLLIRQYHAPAQDIDDLIGQALLDFVTVARAGRPCQDGLFLVIARRRACDFWRKRHAELPLDAARNVGYTLDDTHLQGQIIQRRLARETLSKGHLAKGRLRAITDRILAGSSFSEACKASGIPRGSRGRYRHALRSFVEGLLAGRSRRASRHRPATTDNAFESDGVRRGRDD
jgi:DNA-directed RNA polymerase specialized sigma24 family protein